MSVLTSSTGRRLDFVHHSGILYLQTLLWILCATVCGTEQYFNVEVRALGLSSFPFAGAAPRTVPSAPWIPVAPGRRGLQTLFPFQPPGPVLSFPAS